MTSPDTESHLVLLLNQLCRRLMKNLDLLDFFFHANNQSNKHNNNHHKGSSARQAPGAEEEEDDDDDTKFLIFSILVNFLHRDGKVGQQAKDALLHCMSLSKKNEAVGKYIARHSNFCTVRRQKKINGSSEFSISQSFLCFFEQVLATGLSGLYSVLPRRLPASLETNPTWYMIQRADLEAMPEPVSYTHLTLPTTPYV